MTDIQPLIRIVIRYIVGALVARGALSVHAGDLFLSPEVLTAVVGVLAALLTEGWYRLAKKHGKAT